MPPPAPEADCPLSRRYADSRHVKTQIRQNSQRPGRLLPNPFIAALAEFRSSLPNIYSKKIKLAGDGRSGFMIAFRKPARLAISVKSFCV
jgi:hypothetical protein